MQRRLLFASTALFLPVPGLIRAQDGNRGRRSFGKPECDKVPVKGQPGDYGYLHCYYHDEYALKEIFGQHCTCGQGECRVTISRRTGPSERDIDLMINGLWRPVTLKTFIPAHKVVRDFAPRLLNEVAHVCAYGLPENEQEIRCAYIPPHTPNIG